ncbi:MAG: hypothetical protein ACPGJS_04385 [Flammeovirgaceae bacterium]
MSGKEIDKVFADKLKDHRVKPSSKVWKHIDKQLGKDDKKPFAWWKWAPLLMLLMAGVYYFWPQFEKPPYTDLAQEATPSRNFEQVVESIEKENIVTTAKADIDQAVIKPQKTKKKTKKTTNRNFKNAKAKNHNKPTKQAKSVVVVPHPDLAPSPDVQDTLPTRNEAVVVKELDDIHLTDEEITNPVLKSDPKSVQLPSTAKQKVEKKKKKRFKVEITIPSRNKRLRKLGSQQTQGVAINFKKVLHNVFDN